MSKLYLCYIIPIVKGGEGFFRMNKKDIKVSFVLTLVSMVGIIFVMFNQINSIPVEALKGMPKEVVMVISFIQSTVIVALMSFIGLKLARATNLNNGILGWIYSEEKSKYKLNKESLIIAIVLAFIYSTLTVFADKFLWGPYIPEIASTAYKFDPVYLLSGMIYGGVVEEIMLRLFVLSLIVFALYKIFARKKDKKNIPTYIYCLAIVVAAILFGIGHLPATLSYFATINSAVILRMIIMNGIPGVIFGYLYWKKGLEYAMIAHIFGHVFNQLIWLPILF